MSKRKDMIEEPELINEQNAMKVRAWYDENKTSEQKKSYVVDYFNHLNDKDSVKLMSDSEAKADLFKTLGVSARLFMRHINEPENVDLCINYSTFKDTLNQVKREVEWNIKRKKLYKTIELSESDLDYENENKVYDFIIAAEHNDGELNLLKYLQDYSITKNVAESVLLKCEEIATQYDMSINPQNYSEEDVEDYGYLSKREAKKGYKFWNDAAETLKNYISNHAIKKVSVVAGKPRKPRKKKPVDPVKAVKKLNFMAECESPPIKSIKPEKIFDKQVLWVYNTGTRKLVRYVSMSSATLEVKGSTLLNVDFENSGQKHVRKPDAFFAENVTKGPALKRGYKALSGKETKLSHGRINKHCVLLAVA